MRSEARGGPSIAERVAFGALILFLVAVTSALALTLLSVPPAIKILAAAAVVPVLVLAIVLLLIERRRRPWSFLGAAVLATFGVGLRLVVNSRPSLEVGGGLPLGVNLAYLALGLFVITTSLWAYAGSVRGRTGAPDA